MQILILPLSVLIIISFSLSQVMTTPTLLNTFQAQAAKDTKVTKDSESNNVNITNSVNNAAGISETTPNAPEESSFNRKDTKESKKDTEVEKIIEKVQRVLETPLIVNPTSSEKVKGKYKIEVSAPEATSVDLGLQTATGPAKSFHLGLLTSESSKFVYEWNSTNTPNWTYNLVAKANYSFNQSLLANSVTFLVDNPVIETQKEKEVRNQALERLGLTQSVSQSTNLVTPEQPSASPVPSLSPSPTATASAPVVDKKTTTPAKQVATRTNVATSEQKEIVPLPQNPQIAAVVNTSTQLGFNPVKVDISPEIRIEKIENTTQANRTGLTLKGKGLPNSIVTLYILSDPIVVTVKTDANGDWTYTLEKPLVAGSHEVFVTVPKPDGSLVRSEVSLFSIAKAAGESQEEGLVLVADSGNKFQIFITYTTGLIMLAVVILLAIFFFRKPQVAEDVVD